MSDLARRFRDRFLIADPNLLYFDGNSLGRLPLRVAGDLARQIEHSWGNRLVRAWGEGWMQLPERVAEKIAQVIGAAPQEVLACDSTSVNLFKLTMAALTYQTGRSVILTDALNFPSDLYVFQGCAAQTGRHRVQIVESSDGLTVDVAAYERAITSDVAVVALSHVAFKSGFMADLSEMARLAHAHGALLLVDFSHSAGAVPIDFDGWEIDLAVGCTYKYINGGPGAPAYLAVRQTLLDHLTSPIWGWLGSDHPFDFELDYQPAAGIRRFAVGTPPVLSMAAIEAGLDLIHEAGLDAIRAASVDLTERFIARFDQDLAPLGFDLLTPRDPDQRGSHVALGHPHAWEIDQALIREESVIPDFRAPDCIRFGFNPLYNTAAEIDEGVERLVRIIRSDRWRNQAAHRTFVT